ncbi:MAG: MBOAT family protein [Ruminococcaceae bacterium]|nr:MBOAT family protein [Oscillospiraceae bacterium]
MLFSDLFFLYAFLPLCLILYFVCRNIHWKNAVLIVFSLIFYAWGEPLWIILMIGSVGVNYFCGLLIDRFRDTKFSKVGVALSLVVSLGLLVAFKYTGFITENLNAILPFDIPVPNISLPIGISFYTFQIISYILDAYWGKVKVQKNPLKFLMYVSLFPQLVAGPIVRYGVIEKEIDSRVSTAADISEGITRFIVGLGKKVIIADNISKIVISIFGSAEKGYTDLSTVSVLGVWYGIVLVALWYFFDFSGYSDMAIGLGRIFGFKFNENFNYPFISKNITEFWQRWHISLGSFFRDYLLYVPIFGKRRQYLSLFLVWFCTGLWHGASWNFIIWGLYFGVFIFIERKIGNKRMRKIPAALSHLYALIVIAVGFGIFHFEDMSVLGNFFKSLVGLNGNSLVDVAIQTKFMNNIFLFAAAVLFSMPVIPKLRKLIADKLGAAVVSGTAEIICNVIILIGSSILLVNTTDHPFLYFRF